MLFHMPELPATVFYQYRTCIKKDRLPIQFLLAAVTVFLTFTIGNSLAIGAENFFKLKQEGIQARTEKNWDTAIDRLNRAAKIRPDDAEVQYLLGTSLGFSGQYKKAQAALKRALAINPQYGDATLALARNMSWAGDHESALAEVTQFLSTQADNTEALAFAGRLNYFLKRYDRASTYYTRTLQLDPKNVEALIGKGDVLLAQNRYDDAEKAYARVAEVAPNTKGLNKKLKASLERPTRWRVDLNVERTSFQDTANSDWYRVGFNTSYALTQQTNVIFGYEFFERFKEGAHAYTFGGSHQFTDWFWARASIGMSAPRADYLAKEQYNIGATARLWKGRKSIGYNSLLGATFLKLDYIVPRFIDPLPSTRSTTHRLEPALQQYLGDNFWVNFKAVNLWDQTSTYNWGYFVRGDWQIADKLRIYGGYGDVPELSIQLVSSNVDAARILRTKTLLLGVTFNLTPHYAMHITYTRDDRDLDKLTQAEKNSGRNRHIHFANTVVLGTTIRF